MDGLSRESISIILSLLLTDSEKEAINFSLNENPKTLFEKEETFLLNFEKIPQLKNKLELWQFIHDFEENLNIHQITVDTFFSAILEIKTNKFLLYDTYKKLEINFKKR